jgi:hypothetical protein
MKSFNLNIKLDEPVKRQVEDGTDKDGRPKFRVEDVSPIEVSIQWISVMLERALNQPKIDVRSGQLRPTVEVNMAVQRRYGKVMESLESNVNGIVEMEDEDFTFLTSKFHQAQISVQREVNKILVRIDDALGKVKEVERGNTNGSTK